jgi:hypothetical protein
MIAAAGGAIIYDMQAMDMRVLIADRNAWLLESIARAFAHQFSIQTATTHEQCNELLLRGEFALAVISEKLADGPGLRLLGQIARNSPDTLRVLAARGSRLQLLKGKLVPFGLFRTLAYPIEPQKLLSVLMLARAGLESEVAALATRNVPVVGRRADEVPAASRSVALPPQAQHAGPSMPVPAAIRPVAERISLLSTEASFSINVPSTIASMRRARRSNLPAAPRPAPVARQVSGVRVTAASVQHPAPQSAPSQPVAANSAAPPPPRLSAQSAAFQHALERRRTAKAAAGNQVVSQSSQRGRVRRPARMRTKVVLGATIAAVFLVTTLTLNLVDSSVHVTQASAPRPERKQSDIAALPRSSTPVSLTPPEQIAVRRVSPKPDAAQPDAKPVDPQIAASATPAIADPSSFSSEAYEPIYSN